MKVKELKELIKDADDDLDVYVYADHGQSEELAAHAEVEMMGPEGIVHPDDYEGNEKPVLVISS